MRLVSLFGKTMIESFRDWKVLIMTLSFAPFFVFLMYFYLAESPETHRIVVVNRDVGAQTSDGSSLNAGREIVAALTSVQSAEGARALALREEEDLDAARDLLQDGTVDLVVEVPPDLSLTIAAYLVGDESQPAVIRTYGDPSKAGYLMAAVWSDVAIYEYAAGLTGVTSPLLVDATSVTGATSLTDFDLYVPGLLALSLMMLMFTAAAALIREKDTGTIVRLRMSNMRALEWLIAVSLAQIVLGILALALTYWAAVLLGYESTGSTFALLVVGVLTSLSVMAIGVVVAAFLRTIFDLMTVGSFPFFVLMFFSGGMFPLPQVRLFDIGGQVIGLADVLPTTHSVAALGQILSFGAGLGDLVFELGAIAVLTVAYYAVGGWLFVMRHMRATA